MNNQNFSITVDSKQNQTKQVQTKYKKTSKGNIKIRRVVLVEVYGDGEFEFENTYDASIWYKKNSDTTAELSNITSMMLRVAKGERKHMGGYFVYIEGINL